VVKRLTDALKGEPFTPQIFPLFLDAFKVLLQANFNGESSRSLSLFVTYALHDSRASYVKRPLRSKPSTLRLRKGTPPTLTPGSTPRSVSPGQDINSPGGLPLAELGVAVLGMLADLLCDPSNANEIVRFAKNVTGKVRFCVAKSHDHANVSSGFCTSLQSQTIALSCLLLKF
jgi:hypothetical protein